jgi:copper chaperone
MIFFIFSLIASFAGTLFSGILFPVSLNIKLSVGSSLSGIISFWPFIVVLVIVLLAILWYQTIRNVRNNKTRTSSRVRQSGLSVTFLGALTVVVVLLMAAPYYLRLTDKQEQNATTAENQVELFIKVQGMDCGGCEQLINRRVSQLAGVDSVSASHVREEVYVMYDRSKVNLDEISMTIEESGYTVVFE